MSRSEIRQLLSTSIGDQQDLVKKLKLLCDQCEEIESFQHEYDYSVNNLGNGFRSLVKAVNKYFQKLDDVVKKNEFKGQLKTDYSTTASTLCKSLRLALLVRKKGCDFDASQMTELDYEFYTEFFDIEAQDVQPLLGSVSLFHLKTGLDVILKRILTLANLYTASLWESMRMIFSPSFSSFVVARTAVCMDRHYAESMTVTGIRMLGMRMINRIEQGDTKIQRLHLESKNEWMLVVRDPSAPAILQQVAHRTTMTSSLLIKPSNMEKNNNRVIFHAHGGAFCAVNAQMVAGMQARISKITRVPILLAEYRKTPENKYPAGLQDVFDLYALLTSGDESIERILGFVPKEVILTGDSAGSHLVLGVAQILNRLRREQQVRVMMPKSIAVQYPCAVPSFISVPSFAMMTIDPLLSTGFVGSAAGWYPPLDPELEDGWYRKRDGTLRQSLARFSDRVKDPLFNLLNYTGYEDMKDIALFIIGCEMDPLLDHSIMIAKMWHGPVTLDIVPDVFHGYISFYLSSLLKNELQIFYDQMTKAVEFVATTNNNNINEQS